MAIRRFLWDDVDDCVLEETDEHGTTLVTYTHEPGPFGPLLKENRGGTKSYYHFDALGSTTMLTDDTGAVTDTFQYDAWGTEVARTGTTPTPYTWCGRWGYQDDTATTGGYYIRARSYQPTVARWASVDPLFLFAIVIPYVYASSRSVNNIDPSGLIIFTDNDVRNDRNQWKGPCPTLAENANSLKAQHFVEWKRSPDEKGLLFSQLVTIEITIITSCPDNILDGTSCGTPAADKVTCRNNRYTYAAYFYETLTKNDNQACKIDRDVTARFATLCPHTSPCCNFSYESIVTKEITAKAGLRRDGLHILKGNVSAEYRCFDMDAPQPDPNPEWPDSMPANTLDPGLAPISPSQHEIWVSEKTITLTHDKCSNALHTCSVSGYHKE